MKHAKEITSESLDCCQKTGRAKTSNNGPSPRHFLTLRDFTKAELVELLDLAKQLKRMRISKEDHPYLRGRCLALLFQKPSNRTRISFEVGMYQLGGNVVVVNPEDIKIGDREPTADVARVISRYVDGVLIRAMSHTLIEEFARSSSIPVINGLCDRYHPCQALSDVLTIQEKLGTTAGKRLVFVGDGNNVCNSLINAAAHFDFTVTVSCPEGFEPDHRYCSGPFEVIHDPKKAVEGADIIYTDVWTSMGQEEETQKRLIAFQPYQVTKDLLDRASNQAIFMHCLPAHRGEEVSDEIAECPQSVIFDQAENRLHTQKAILCKLLGDMPFGALG